MSLFALSFSVLRMAANISLALVPVLCITSGLLQLLKQSRSSC